jgi:hypothetical protein
MAAPGGMRLALVHLVGLRNRLFAFLDVAEKTRDGNMISRIAGQRHHNLEVTGKLGDPRHRQPSLIMPAYVDLRVALVEALRRYQRLLLSHCLQLCFVRNSPPVDEPRDMSLAERGPPVSEKAGSRQPSGLICSQSEGRSCGCRQLLAKRG